MSPAGWRYPFDGYLTVFKPHESPPEKAPRWSPPVSGFIAVNMSKRLALHVTDGLLGERFPDLTPQVIDSAGEVTNIIVGGIKSSLSRGEWAFSNITVPSVIVGDGYQVAFATGLELLEVCFEVDNPEAIMASDRMLHVTLSLLKL